MKHLSIDEHRSLVFGLLAKNAVPSEASVSFSPSKFESLKRKFDLKRGIVVGKSFVSAAVPYAKNDKIVLIEPESEGFVRMADAFGEIEPKTVEVVAGTCSEPLLFNPFYLKLMKISPKTTTKRALIYLSFEAEIYLIKRRGFYLSIEVRR